jgi:hypothetical protein
MRTTVFSGLIGLMMLIATSCTNDDGGGSGRLSVRLTDSPANYDEVLIDIQGIQIHVSDDNSESGWQSLDLLRPGVYNLLDFTNGIDSLLADTLLPVGTISQMRLILGDNNQVKVDGVYHDLDTPSAQQSGLKFNIHATIQDGIEYHLWIDFDAARSVVAKGNGTYSLKPVISTFTEATSGAVKGVISPVAANPVVYAISAANDTISTYADESTGEFLIRGLDAGSYTIKIEPVSPYIEKEIEDVDVTNGEVHDMGTVNLSMPI